MLEDAQGQGVEKPDLPGLITSLLSIIYGSFCFKGTEKKNDKLFFLRFHNAVLLPNRRPAVGAPKEGCFAKGVVV